MVEAKQITCQVFTMDPQATSQELLHLKGHDAKGWRKRLPTAEFGPGAESLCKKSKQTAKIPQEAEPANPLQDQSQQYRQLLYLPSTPRRWSLLRSSPIMLHQAAIPATVANKICCDSFHLSSQRLP